MAEPNEETIMVLFNRVDMYGCVDATENLKNIFTELPLDHYLRAKYNYMLIDYEIIGENNGN